MTTPFTDYSDLATPAFRASFDALRTSYQTSSSGATYTVQIGSYLTGALTTLNAGLKAAMTNPKPSTVITYVLPAVVFVAGVIYTVFNLIKNDKLSQLNVELTIGVRDNYFKTIPNISGLVAIAIMEKDGAVSVQMVPANAAPPASSAELKEIQIVPSSLAPDAAPVVAKPAPMNIQINIGKRDNFFKPALDAKPVFPVVTRLTTEQLKDLRGLINDGIRFRTFGV